MRSVLGSEDVRGARAVQGPRDVPEELPVGWGGADGENRAPKSFCLALGPQLRAGGAQPSCRDPCACLSQRLSRWTGLSWVSSLENTRWTVMSA